MGTAPFWITQRSDQRDAELAAGIEDTPLTSGLR
jgi:hypothetical protein